MLKEEVSDMIKKALMNGPMSEFRKRIEILSTEIVEESQCAENQIRDTTAEESAITDALVLVQRFMYTIKNVRPASNNENFGFDLESYKDCIRFMNKYSS
jgi:hypothetical protein